MKTRYINKATALATLLTILIVALQAYQYSQCDGLFVRGLFWFECLT